MNPLKKVATAIRVAKCNGIRGVARVIGIKFSQLRQRRKQHVTSDVFSTEPMFRYATCNDLVQLMAIYPEYCRYGGRDAGGSAVWGLKAVGTLFCVDKIVRIDAKRILEVGAGWNCDFDRHFGSSLDYWLIDEPSQIGGCKESESTFEAAVRERRHTRFVRGLLGSSSAELPDGTFDLVFSISVVEHVPQEDKAVFYQDMYRVLKPGGYIVHSIDIPSLKQGVREFNHISQAGFVLPKRPDLGISVRAEDGDPTLFEDLGSVFHGYLGLGRPDKWERLKTIHCHHPTILILARRPLVPTTTCK